MSISAKGYLKNIFRLAAVATVAAPLAFSAAALAQEPAGDQLAPAAQATVSAPQQQVTAQGSGPLSYDEPWLLLTGLGLVGLWWLLRTQQPPPQIMPSSLARLISRVNPTEETPDQTPLWQFYLRLTALAIAITGAAGPRFDPQEPLPGSGPLMLVVDNGWASAPNWADRTESALDLIDRAEREGKMVIVLPTAQPGDNSPVRTSGLMTAAEARRTMLGMEPLPWPEDRQAAIDALQTLDADQASVVWLSNGLGGDGTLALVQQLQRFGTLRVIEDGAADAPQLLVPPRFDGDSLTAVVKRPVGTVEETISVIASAEDGRVVARTEVVFGVGDTEAQATFNLPAELRNQLAQISIEGENSAGAVVLLDERWRRRPVGLVTTVASQPAQPLLNEFHYIGRALDPYVDLRQGSVEDLLKGDLSVVVLGDSNPVDPATRRRLDEWIRGGGTVLRFAGPRLAEAGDDLVPVELRHEGGRTMGGSMSWGQPARLAPFESGTPFDGLSLPQNPGDITVQRQVLAQPGLAPGEAVWARLEDGTPLVTAEQRGEGWLVLVHTTANADWSNLSMSQLFVDMLRAVVSHSQGVGAALGNDQTLPPWRVLNGEGRLDTPLAGARGLTAQAIQDGTVSPRHPPGFYGGEDVRRAHNLATAVSMMEPIPALPEGVARQFYEAGRAVDLKGALIAIAVALAVIDGLALMGQRGLLPAIRRREDEVTPETASRFAPK